MLALRASSQRQQKPTLFVHASFSTRTHSNQTKMVLKLIDGELQFEDQLLSNIQHKNNVEVLPILTSEVVYSNVSDGSGATLLHFAAEYGNTDVVQHLLSFEVNVNTRDKLGRTPLLLAVTRRNQDISIETIKVLLKAGANIFEADIYGRYPLQHVVDYPVFSKATIVINFFKILREYCKNKDSLMADLLVKAGCSIERAMYLRNATVTEMMIKQGCEVDASYENSGHTALHLAAKFMDEPNVKVLLASGANASKQTINGVLPLSAYLFAANHQPYVRNLEIVKALLARYFTASDKTEETKTSFRVMLYKGSQEEIQHMLQYDVDLSMKSENGFGIFHILVYNTHANVTKPFESKVCNTDLRNRYGCTPLHYVGAASNQSTVKFLLDRGADVNAISNRGNSPLSAFFLDMTTTRLPGETEVIKLLLQHGADVQVIIPQEDVQKTLFDLVIQTQRFNLGELFVARLTLLEKLGTRIIDLIRSKIGAHQQFKTHYDSCQQHLEDMQNIVVYESITLFKLLSQSEKEIIKRYAYSDELLEEFENFDVNYCSDKSIYYYEILSARIENVLPKIKLIRDATKIIFDRIVPQLNNNYLVVRKIIDYLDDEDMKVLNKV